MSPLISITCACLYVSYVFICTHLYTNLESLGLQLILCIMLLWSYYLLSDWSFFLLYAMLLCLCLCWIQPWQVSSGWSAPASSWKSSGSTETRRSWWTFHQDERPWCHPPPEAAWYRTPALPEWTHAPDYAGGYRHGNGGSQKGQVWDGQTHVCLLCEKRFEFPFEFLTFEDILGKWKYFMRDLTNTTKMRVHKYATGGRG